MLDLILTTGAIGPAIIVAGYILWALGVRDPFMITAGALLFGLVGGQGVNAWVKKVWGYRRPTATTAR